MAVVVIVITVIIVIIVIVIISIIIIFVIITTLHGLHGLTQSVRPPIHITIPRGFAIVAVLTMFDQFVVAYV